MKLGQLGEIVFEVSRKNVVNYENLTRKTSADYSEQKTQNSFPRLEFSNPRGREISFHMKLVRSLMNKDPLILSQKINEYILKGEVIEFIIGSSYVNSGRFVITDSQETFKVINAEKVDVLELQLNLKEYIDDDSAV